jgi:hypothetical protein
MADYQRAVLEYKVPRGNIKFALDCVPPNELDSPVPHESITIELRAFSNQMPHQTPQGAAKHAALMAAQAASAALCALEPFVYKTEDDAVLEHLSTLIDKTKVDARSMWVLDWLS